MTIKISRTFLLLGAAGAALGLAPLASAAEEPKLAELMSAPDEKPDPNAAERARLNREQADAARAQLDANAASQQAHDDAVRQREETIRQQEADAAKAAADHQAAMTRWEETVKACKRGDRVRCHAQ